MEASRIEEDTLLLEEELGEQREILTIEFLLLAIHVPHCVALPFVDFQRCPGYRPPIVRVSFDSLYMCLQVRDIVDRTCAIFEAIGTDVQFWKHGRDNSFVMAVPLLPI